LVNLPLLEVPHASDGSASRTANAQVPCRYESNEFNQVPATELPGVLERTVRQRCRRFEGGGEAGLLGRSAESRVGKRVPLDLEHDVETLCRIRYNGSPVPRFHEHVIRRSSLQLRAAPGPRGSFDQKVWPSMLNRRGVDRRKRTRRPLPGLRPRRPLSGLMPHQDGPAQMVGRSGRDGPTRRA
jgi:hypothetical protein